MTGVVGAVAATFGLLAVLGVIDLKFEKAGSANDPGGYFAPLPNSVDGLAERSHDLVGNYVVTVGQVRDLDLSPRYLETDPKTLCNPRTKMCSFRLAASGSIRVWEFCDRMASRGVSNGRELRVMGMWASVQERGDGSAPMDGNAEPALVAYEIGQTRP
jgi:hypothetical protein